MAETWLVTLLLGASSTLLSMRLNRTTVSACSGYWAGWLFLLASASLATTFDLIPHTSDESFQLVRAAHVGAFAGFLVGTLVSGKVLTRTDEQNRVVQLDNLANKLWKPFALGYFSLGCFLLAERVFTVGVSETLFLDIRLNYFDTSLSFMGRIASYLSTLLPVASIMLGMTDAAIGVRMRRIVILTLASAPFGLSMGGRGFLLGLILPYAASYLLMYTVNPGKSGLRNFVRSISTYVIVAFVLFAILGGLRTAPETRQSSRQGNGFLQEALNMFIAWFGVSLPAVGPNTDYFAYYVSRGYGQEVLSFPSAQLEEAGVLLGTRTVQRLVALEYVRRDFGILGSAPPTIIPYLVMDVGYAWMPAYLGMLMAICQIISVRWRGISFFKHFVAVLALIAAFTSIQVMNFLEASNSLGLIWAAIISLILHDIKVRPIYEPPSTNPTKDAIRDNHSRL